MAGEDPGFQVRGAHLKKLRRAEGDAKNFGVFRVKKHDFTPKNHILSNCGGRREKCWGISCENHDFTLKKNIFSNFRVIHLVINNNNTEGIPSPVFK